MKDTGSTITRRLQVGSRLKVIDNSGAKIIELISVKGYKGVKNRYSRGGVGDMITATVKVGNPELKHKLVKALIVQQKGSYRRPDGTRVKFDENCAILLKSDEGDPKGTAIKGPVAKEVVDRWKKVGKIARVVI